MEVKVKIDLSEATARTGLLAVEPKVEQFTAARMAELLEKALPKLPAPPSLRPYPTDRFYPSVPSPSVYRPMWYRSPVPKPPAICQVIFNNPATVVIWDDHTKTVVKCQPGDTFSKETGLAMAILKKVYGNKGNYNDVFRKWVPRDE